jgi:PhnB protein
MAAINPYLTFAGKAEEAFNFYKSVFGGEFAMLQRFKDTPGSGQTDPKDSNLIMHVALPIGKSNVLMASDVAGPMANGFKEGNNISISISANTKEEADKLYNGLSAGGKQTLPMADQFWGSYFGMLTDKFGINWMMSFDANQTNN